MMNTLMIMEVNALMSTLTHYAYICSSGSMGYHAFKEMLEVGGRGQKGCSSGDDSRHDTTTTNNHYHFGKNPSILLITDIDMRKEVSPSPANREGPFHPANAKIGPRSPIRDLEIPKVTCREKRAMAANKRRQREELEEEHRAINRSIGARQDCPPPAPKPPAPPKSGRIRNRAEGRRKEKNKNGDNIITKD